MQLKNERNHLMGEKILMNVTKSIREDILKEYFGKILNKYKYFNTHFS